MPLSIGTPGDTLLGERFGGRAGRREEILSPVGGRVILERGAGGSAHYRDDAFADVKFADAVEVFGQTDLLLEINADFVRADVALVTGANDVVNPVGRAGKSSPIYGMPTLNVDYAQNVIMVKRGKCAGYSGIENALSCEDNCCMPYGSAQQAIAEAINHVKALET